MIPRLIHSAVCGISGFSIEDSEPVKVFFLVDNGFPNRDKSGGFLQR